MSKVFTVIAYDDDIELFVLEEVLRDAGVDARVQQVMEEVSHED